MPGDTAFAANRIAWLVPIAIAVGTAATCRVDHVEDVSEFLMVSAGATAIAAALARSISRGGSRATIRWVLLGVFFGAYVVQSWWMLADPFGGEWFSPLWRPSDVETALKWSVAGFGAAAATLSVLDRVRQPEAVRVAVGSRTGAVFARRAATVAIVLLVINTPLMVLNDVGVVGTASTLPYRLGGLIQNTQRVLIPMLLLAAMYGSMTAGLTRWFRLLTALYIGMSLFDTIVTTGKLPFLQSLVGTLMVVALSRRLTARMLHAVAIGGVGLILVYPAFSYMRAMRTAAAGGVVATTRSAMEMSLREHSALDGLRGVVFRGVGTEVLASIVAQNARLPDGEWPTALGGSTDVSVYLTRAIFGYRATDAMGVAPSLIGWFYIAFGPEWIVPAMALFVLAAEMLWMRVARARLITRIPILAYCGTLLLLICNEGTLDGQGLVLLVCAASAVGIEVLARIGTHTGGLEHPAGMGAADTLGLRRS